ncbi:MAG: choice-of-anchor tandem repeat GloVer-containing protein [Candidatus Sulfotelmatobacter sp.]
MTGKTSWKTICLGFALWAATATTSSGQTFTTLAYFTDGSSLLSLSSLIQARDGNLYGTSGNGGADGYGSVFKITPSGTLTSVYSFCAQTNCADGSYPYGALALGINGDLYGTTQFGGAHDLGTVFRVTSGGTLTVLHSFGGADGSGPEAGLVLAADGNFYGTTSSGGANSSCPGSDCGTVFKISPSGSLTTLHTFDGTDGFGPLAPLVQGADGSLYGTTVYGGTGDCDGESCGTVFKITTGGEFNSLHSFQFTDGGLPTSPLVQAANGAFYGTTYEGGEVGRVCSGGCGTIFKISSGGTFATVHKFHFSDGSVIYAGLVQGTDQNLYGESIEGSEIFSATLKGQLTVEYSGVSGSAALLQGTDGKFYGTSESDDYPYGQVFSFDMGLGPFAAFVIPTAKVGQTAQILGQGLTGTTNVTFNGVQATSFKVVSDTYMTAVVPSGATTGVVVVTTPTGGLTSNVNFRIAK